MESSSLIDKEDTSNQYSLNNNQNHFFEEPVSADDESDNSLAAVPDIDWIDEAFNAMGGFGKLQKISYLMNTVI